MYMQAVSTIEVLCGRKKGLVAEGRVDGKHAWYLRGRLGGAQSWSYSTHVQAAKEDGELVGVTWPSCAPLR